MKQWDIFIFPHPSSEDPHPCVILSNDGICKNQQLEFVNVLICSTVRPPNRPQKANEVYLNEADGLDWKTLVKCDFIYVFTKADAGAFRGHVCAQHIIEIRRKLQQFL
jgi:PemK-like, MazF-like toxin of type II toxin-antitoxin system